MGEELPLEEVIAHLESIGYERREPVEMVGEYSVRGGILDVFSPESQKPVRIDLFGDQVESIRRFDVESQRSVLKIEECTLLPLTEYQKSEALLTELAELMREADIPGRDLPPPGQPFPGWELVTPMLRQRDASVFSLLDTPDRGVGRAGSDARRGRTFLEAAGADRAVARVRSGPHLFPMGGTCSGRRPAARRLS